MENKKRNFIDMYCILGEKEGNAAFLNLNTVKKISVYI